MRVSVKAVIGVWVVVAGAAGVLARQGEAPNLKDPSTMIVDCPPKYNAKFDTSQGEFVIEVQRDWAPRGAIRFYNLVKNGYYTENRFFRALPNAMMQFGITGDPALNAIWRGARIIDDVRKQTNERGYVSFASGGPNSRTTQIFINLKDNTPLDQLGFVPFGRVTSGMNALEKVYTGYGDIPPNGKGPDQMKIQVEGNAYLLKDFPKLDYIKTATIVEGK